MIRRPLLLMLLIFSGCAHARREQLTSYPHLTEAQSLEILQRRAVAVHSVSASGVLILERPNGESVRLDAAMVTQGNDHFHLRAWKLGRMALDITVNPQGIYLFAPGDEALNQRVRSSGVSATKLANILDLIGENFFRDAKIAAADGQLLLTNQRENTAITCIVERLSLTPRQYAIKDNRGKQQFSLELTDYIDHGGLPYPHQIIARSPDGRIELDLRDVEINTPPPPGAFIPSQRSEKLP